MKKSISRRFRRSPSKGKEQKFFGPEGSEPFFQPAGIQRSADDETVHRAAEMPPEKEKEKEKEKVNRAAEPEKKEEEKNIQRAAEPEKKEEEKIQKKDDGTGAGTGVRTA